MISFTRDLLISLSFVCLSVSVYAQEGQKSTPREVRGSGRVVQEQKNLTPFSTLDIMYLHGKISVEVGGTTSSLEAQLDDNLLPFLRVEEKNNTLKISLRDAQGAPIWVVDESIKILIKTPALKGLAYGGNGSLIVNGLNSDSFSFTNRANGMVTLKGKVNNMNMVSIANGLIQADELIADRAQIATHGNATIRVNAKDLKEVKSGNGQIYNVSKAP